MFREKTLVYVYEAYNYSFLFILQWNKKSPYLMESGWASNKNWQSQVCLYIIHPIINDQKISLALCYVGVASEQIVFNPVLPASPYYINIKS